MLESGRIGAGAGASTGRWRGRQDPGGVGVAVRRVGEASIAAVVVVNAWGDVLGGDEPPPATTEAAFPLRNTTIGVLLTDAALTKADCHLLAQSGHTGYARAIHPAHSRYDGDAIVALATGEVPGADLDLLRAEATETVVDAIRAAVAVQ